MKLWDGTDFEHLRIPYHRPWERRPRPYPLVHNYRHSVVRQDSNDHFNGDAGKAGQLTGQLRVLTADGDTGGSTRYGRVLGNIYTRLRATGLDETAGAAFKDVMFAFNKATLREFELRTAGETFDSITDYVHNRRDSTAMDAYLLLIPYAMGLRLSPAVRAHPLTRALERLPPDPNPLRDTPHRRPGGHLPCPRHRADLPHRPDR